MKAICVTPDRTLVVRDIPTPDRPAPGHLLIEMAASAINHGDKTFLKMPTAAGNPFALGRHDVWGASGSGRVIDIGAGVPKEYAGKHVAAYRSLGRSAESVGLWCERAHVPYTTCVVLPEQARAKDYCGSLVNVMTAYSYLEEIVDAGHNGVIVTAGNSATGHALAALARSRNVPAILLVRSVAAQAALRQWGVEHVLVVDDHLADHLGPLAAKLGTTAIFDGLGGDVVSRIAPILPMNSTIYCYGFLGGPVPLSIPSLILMMKNLTIRRFSNFESRTAKDPDRLANALKALSGVIGNPMFATRLGKEFHPDQIDLAMAYEPDDGSKAVLSF